MVTISAVYPNRPGSRFDVGYYRGSHAALARRLLAPLGLVGLRTIPGDAALDGAAPPFWMIAEMRFASRDAFDRAMAAAGAELFADAANYTDVEPVLQVSADPDDLTFPAPMETSNDA